MADEKIEFLDAYPPGKNLFILILISINVIIISLFILINNIYNKSYAPKSQPLYQVINNNYENDMSYVFKGNVNNNYLLYNNLMWRIVRINNNGSITIILDEPINYLPVNIENVIDLKEYLNTTFKSELDESKLTKTQVCKNEIVDLNNIKCDLEEEDVTLLDINSFIQSLSNDTTYIANDTEIYWLYNSYNEEKAWHSNGTKLSYSNKANLNGVRPVVTLKNDIDYETGTGIKSNPYIISNSNITIGSTVKIKEDYYTVYSTKDEYRLILNNSLADNYTYTGDIRDAFQYLDTTFYEKVEYKSLLMDATWQISSLNKGKIKSEEITSKVGLLNILDLNVSLTGEYYSASSINNKIIILNDGIIYGSKNAEHHLKPCISLNKDIVNSLNYKNGIYEWEEV